LRALKETCRHGRAGAFECDRSRSHGRERLVRWPMNRSGGQRDSVPYSSGLYPEAFTIGPQRSKSDLINPAKSAPEAAAIS
jgi:hypothetical protein